MKVFGLIESLWAYCYDRLQYELQTLYIFASQISIKFIHTEIALSYLSLKMHCLAWVVGKTSILINAKLLSAYSSKGNRSGGV